MKSKKSELFADFDIEDTQENAIDWLHNLFANRFPQVRGIMTDGKGYCCLGVGRKLTGSASYIEEDKLDTATFTDTQSEYRVIGLKSTAGYATGKGSSDLDALAMLNDEDKLSHAEIALVLIKNPDAYFIPEVAEAVKEHFWGGWKGKLPVALHKIVNKK